jgi:hypothetical protein
MLPIDGAIVFRVNTELPLHMLPTFSKSAAAKLSSVGRCRHNVSDISLNHWLPTDNNTLVPVLVSQPATAAARPTQ